MAAVLEISSDSSDTVILTPPEKSRKEQEMDNSNKEIEELVNKYISANASFESKDLEFNPRSLNHQQIDEPELKKVKKLDHGLRREEISESGESDHEDEILQILMQKYNTKKSDYLPKDNVKKLDTKQLKKQEKEIQKQKKLAEKQQKKTELEREKYLKQAVAAAGKNVKPTECLKFITACIDNEIMSEEYGNEIGKFLEEADMEYKTHSQIFPWTITWTRKVESHSVNEDGKLVLNSEEQDTDHILLVMNARNFLTHLNQNTLCGYVQSIKTLFTNKKITLAIYSLNKLLAQFRKKNDKASGSNEFPNINKTKINYSLTELELTCSCSHRLCETPSDLGLFITQFTKAVAEVPFKLQRYEKFQKADWFVAGDNRDCVKVDKTGNGLNRLWKQMLTTFPLARLETAEAISSVYPTVSALMMAYEQCSSKKEGESLLQDIPIRRAAGPLSSSRKIGPELSKKIYNFFTAFDGDVLL